MCMYAYVCMYHHNHIIIIIIKQQQKQEWCRKKLHKSTVRVQANISPPPNRED